jgi:hypothetical protein
MADEIRLISGLREDLASLDIPVKAGNIIVGTDSGNEGLWIDVKSADDNDQITDCRKRIFSTNAWTQLRKTIGTEDGNDRITEKDEFVNEGSETLPVYFSNGTPKSVPSKYHLDLLPVMKDFLKNLSEDNSTTSVDMPREEKDYEDKTDADGNVIKGEDGNPIKITTDPYNIEVYASRIKGVISKENLPLEDIDNVDVGYYDGSKFYKDEEHKEELSNLSVNRIYIDITPDKGYYNYRWVDEQTGFVEISKSYVPDNKSIKLGSDDRTLSVNLGSSGGLGQNAEDGSLKLKASDGTLSVTESGVAVNIDGKSIKKNDSSGTLCVNFNPAGGLELAKETVGLQVKRSANSGLREDASGLAVGCGKGLEASDSVINIKMDSNTLGTDDNSCLTVLNSPKADKANALAVEGAVGTTIKPVYIDENGKPQAIAHTLEKDVPSNAVFTDRYLKVNTLIASPQTGTARYTDTDTYCGISLSSYEDNSQYHNILITGNQSTYKPFLVKGSTDKGIITDIGVGPCSPLMVQEADGSDDPSIYWWGLDNKTPAIVASAEYARNASNLTKGALSTDRLKDTLLESDGSKIKIDFIPTAVDEIIEGYLSLSEKNFYITKTTGEDGVATYSDICSPSTGKIYVDLDTDKTYRHSGVEGSSYIEISKSLTVDGKTIKKTDGLIGVNLDGKSLISGEGGSIGIKIADESLSMSEAGISVNTEAISEITPCYATFEEGGTITAYKDSSYEEKIQGQPSHLYTSMTNSDYSTGYIYNNSSSQYEPLLPRFDDTMFAYDNDKKAMTLYLSQGISGLTSDLYTGLHVKCNKGLGIEDENGISVRLADKSGLSFTGNALTVNLAEDSGLAINDSGQLYTKSPIVKFYDWTQEEE